jgi:hypothetical protein
MPNDKVIKWGTALVAGGTALIVYGLTIAPGLTWAHFGSDGGEFITAVLTSGIPHPPGYPTYLLLGRMVSWLPWSSMALGFNWFSAVATAMAILFTSATAWELSPQNKPATSLAVGLTLAFAPLVWGQATITEVYGLNLAFVAAVIWALVGKRPSLVTGLLLGLSLTTHLTSILLLPLALYLTSPKQWLRLSLGVALGLIPFLIIPLLVQTSSPVIWGQPHTLAGWWWLVTGALYRPNVLTADWIGRLPQWSIILLQQLAWLGIPLSLWGLITRHTPGPRLYPSCFITAVLYLLYALTYNTYDALVLTLPAILLLALLLTDRLSTWRWLALGLPLVSFLLNFNQQNLRQDDVVQSRANQLLQSAPTQAILTTPGDGTIFTLWTLQHIEEKRPDLLLVDQNLFAFDWYRAQLQTHYPQVVWPNGYDLEGLAAYNKDRPFCHIQLAEPNIDCHQD